MSQPGVAELVAALREFRDSWECAQASATYVSPGGALVTVAVAGALVTIEDDDGNIVALPDEEPEA
jgi:hypothetical protein